jgi:hypothetical protein
LEENNASYFVAFLYPLRAKLLGWPRFLSCRHRCVSPAHVMQELSRRRTTLILKLPEAVHQAIVAMKASWDVNYFGQPVKSTLTLV